MYYTFTIIHNPTGKTHKANIQADSIKEAWESVDTLYPNTDTNILNHCPEWGSELTHENGKRMFDP